MKQKVTLVVFADLIFILLLSVAGVFSGALGSAVYYSAFVIPLVTALAVDKKSNSPSPYRLSAGIKPRDLGLFVPLVPLTVGTVFLVSLLTTLALSVFGLSDSVTLEGNVFVLIIIHALLPALCEEMLFRYVPIKLLAAHSRVGAVVLSALFFSLVHTNLFQIPYAFLAGVIFATVDIAFGSILPSVILHFVNNLCSVYWILYAENTEFAVVYVAVMGALCLICGLCLAVRRKAYASAVKCALSKGEKYKPGRETAVLAVLTLFIALTKLFIK